MNETAKTRIVEELLDVHFADTWDDWYLQAKKVESLAIQMIDSNDFSRDWYKIAASAVKLVVRGKLVNPMPKDVRSLLVDQTIETADKLFRIMKGVTKYTKINEEEDYYWP